MLIVRGDLMRMERSSSKSSLFLIELLIIIAFFAVSSVVCIRIFARANMLSLESRDLNRAVTAAQSAAESFKRAGGDIREAAMLLDALIERDGGLLVYFDEEWNPVNMRIERGYTMHMKVDAQGDLAVADIAVTGEYRDQTVYELRTMLHLS